MKSWTKLIAAIWERLVGSEFAEQVLVAQVRHDGGHDIKNIADSDLLALVNGRFEGNWSEVAFSFSELLSYYSAVCEAKSMTDRQVVAWCLAAILIGECCRRDATDWDLQINHVLDGLAHTRKRLETDEIAEVLGCVFRSEHNASNARPE